MYKVELSNKLTKFLSLLMLACSFGSSAESPVVAKVNGDTITAAELIKGSEQKIYQAEMKVFELKKKILQRQIISKLVQTDPRSEGMTESEYIDEHVIGAVTVSKQQVKDFINERKIPHSSFDEAMEKRIKDYVKRQYREDKVKAWLKQKEDSRQVVINLAEPQAPIFNVPVGNAPYTGNANAKVTVIEYSDFQCPFCSKANDTVKKLKLKYDGKVKFVFKQYPLPFHRQAQKAAEASLCAYEQGRGYFWEMHEELFESSRSLAKKMRNDGELIKASAKAMGLDAVRFSECFTSGKMAGQVKADTKEGKRHGVASVPIYFINGRVIQGAQAIDVFVKMIDAQLAQ